MISSKHIRLIHFADLHIGVENYGRTDPATGLSTRLGDFLAAYDELVDYAIAERVDLVVFSGDAYKSRDPSQTHQREFARRIRRLIEADIPAFLLVGNHDLPQAVGRATSLEIFPTLSVPKVFIGNQLGTHLIQTRNGPVQIIALPWVRRSSFLAREDTRGLTFNEVNQRLEETLTRLLRQEADRLDTSIPAILSAHVSLPNAKLGSEQTMMVGRDYMMMQSNLAHPNLDYIALGHIHRSQVLSQLPPTVYSGSLQRVDFGEENDPKGFYVVEIDPALLPGRRAAKYDFHPVKAREFLTIPVEIAEGDADPTATCLRAIARRHVQDAVVRVNIKISQAQEPLLRMETVRQALEGAHFIAAINKETDRRHRTRLGNWSAESVKPLDALQAYLESRGVSQERTRKLKEHASRLMAEQGIEE